MTEAGRPGAGAGRAATVRLLVADDRNRNVLREHLAGRHEVVEGPPKDFETAGFDACLLDAGAFERHHGALEAKRRAAEPAFLPSLFLARERAAEELPDAVWDLVDEVVATPVSPRELSQRLENLLERRRLSLTLKRRQERSEDRFQALFDTAPDPIVVTSTEGVIAEANESFARAVGEPREALVGADITEVGFSPSDAIERVLLRVVGEDDPDASAVALEPEDGDPMVTELNADAVTALGEASERIGVFRDVTERERREAELRRQNERLEEFAGTIAHDLRNPLAVAQGHVDVGREADDGVDIEAVAESLGRMDEMIDQILTLAQQGQLVMDPSPVSIEAVATEAWDTVETEGAALSVEDDERILADAGRLRECFENLFRNAVEHGTDGQTGGAGEQPGDDGGSVTVRVGTLDAHGFYVADDGPGIPPAKRPDVFEAGYTESANGTGFGLSIVRQIAEGHGWTVDATAAADGGARFEFRGTEPAPGR